MARPFTVEERELLVRLAANAVDFEVLVAQIDRARYVEPWFEGSQSFEIEVDESAPRYSSGEHLSGGRQIIPGCRVYTNDVDRTDDHFVGEAFLWIQDGLLGAMEYAWVTDEMPSSLPRIGQLED